MKQNLIYFSKQLVTSDGRSVQYLSIATNCSRVDYRETRSGACIARLGNGRNIWI